MDIDPILIAIIGVVGLVALVLAVVWFRKRAKLLSLPELPVEQAAGHQGEAIVVGQAAGEEITSPWTERTGVFFSAKEVIEEHRPQTGARSGRSGSGSRRRHTRDLGEAGLPLTLASRDGDATVLVQPDGSCDVTHLPKLRTGSTGSRGGLSGLSVNVGGVRLGGGHQRSWIEERGARHGDTLYVAGTVTDDGGQPMVGGKVSVASKDPAAQARWELLRGSIAAVVGVAAVGFAVFALVA